MSATEFIKAWNLQPGDKIRMKHEKYTEVLNVIGLYRHTQEFQGRSSAVTVVTASSYSPNWHVFESHRTLEIDKRK